MYNIMFQMRDMDLDKFVEHLLQGHNTTPSKVRNIYYPLPLPLHLSNRTLSLVFFPDLSLNEVLHLWWTAIKNELI